VKALPLKQNMSANQKQIVNERKDEVVNPKEMNKPVSGFSFEHELNKVKIPVPLIELIKSKVYREATFKTFKNAVNSTPIPSDEINLQDEKPTIIVGSKTFDQPDDNSEYPPPFYVTFSIHDQLLHNCLLDSGASHNLMPKLVMEALGLSVTKPYHDLYAFDSRAVKCIGVIKDLVVNLTQVPMKSVLMDIVVADISPKFGMLLS